MPIGFAIFITALLVSVIVLLIYHYVILGTSGGNEGGGPGGYNYDVNIAYLNTLTNALAAPMAGPLNSQLGFADGTTYPNLPGGAPRFRDNLTKP
jgi:hypothetical protein